MLKSITICDFQNHVKRTIDFDERIMTITGPSDAGKSASLRALRWLMTNQPGGDGFIREGARDAVVEIDIDDHKVKRSRGKSGNLYFLDGSEFKAFGNTTPDDIQSVLNVGTVNFQGQHDPVFWFAETAGEVSRQLNAVVDLSIIDESLTHISGQLDGYRAISKVTKNRLDKAKEKKAELEWVLQADLDYKEIEKLADQIEQDTTYTARLRGLVRSIDTNIDQRDNAIQRVSDIQAVGVLGNQLRKSIASNQSLNDVISAIELSNKALDRGCLDMTQLEELKIELDDLFKQRFELSRIINRGDVAESKTKIEFPDLCSGQTLVDEFNLRKKRRQDLAQLEKKLAATYADYEKFRKEKEQADFVLESETEGLCPICGGELK